MEIVYPFLKNELCDEKCFFLGFRSFSRWEERDPGTRLWKHVKFPHDVRVDLLIRKKRRKKKYELEH